MKLQFWFVIPFFISYYFKYRRCNITTQTSLNFSLSYDENTVLNAAHNNALYSSYVVLMVESLV